MVMRYLFTFYIIAFSCSSVIFFSCTKTDAGTANTQQDILMRHKWKHYQTRAVTIDTITHVIVKDTMYLVDSCYQNSLYVFAADSVLRRNFICFTAPTEKEGRWFLKIDSAFAASIPVRTSYGTSTVVTDFGLPYGKMKLLTEMDFQLTSSTAGFTYGSLSGYSTYYLKADN